MKKHYSFIFFFLSFSLCSNTQCWETASASFVSGVGIRNDGTVWTWGVNKYGALGDGSYLDKNKPNKIEFKSDFKALSTGDNNGAIIKKDGSIWVWGYGIYPNKKNDSSSITTNIPAPIDDSKDWQSVSVLKTALAIKNDGTLWAWGNNFFGQLGDGTRKPRYTPQKVGVDTDWQYVNSTYYYSFAIKKNGTLWVWGLSHFNSLSNSLSNIVVSKPLQVGTDNDWLSVHFFEDNCIALKKNKTLWAFDNRNIGGLNISKSTPKQIGTDSDWLFVSTNMYGDFAHAIKKNGSLWAWGENSSGQLGDGTLINRDSPVQIGSSFDWSSVSSGGFFSIGSKKDGSIWSWGDNKVGQLGLDSNIGTITEPTYIPTNDCVFQKPKTIEPFNIYPNPTSSSITIKGENMDDANITIYNLLGQLIKSTKLNNRTFDISELASGTYLLYIRTSNQVFFAKKIIKI